jgi:uncharacterized membrane protein YphA (DoxX/SURF4 family)
MKKVAVVLILFGSGLTAFGISGFSGGLGTDTRLDPPQLNGSFEWPLDERLEIVVGVISLTGGLILRKDPK